ncbi:hypothetical protein ABZX75_24775 [Streptomyces sp. NPDC003038]|uniref:hypothetical protein n=1 Tax=unclassified Streptomyces TaxID=2593676 RepID=UPI0033B99490
MKEALEEFLDALSPESRARVEREPGKRQEDLARQWKERLASDPDSAEASSGFLVPGMSKAAHEAEYVVSTSLEPLGEHPA